MQIDDGLLLDHLAVVEGLPNWFRKGVMMPSRLKLNIHSNHYKYQA